MNKPAPWIIEQIKTAQASVAKRPEWMRKLAQQDLARLNDQAKV